MAAHQRGGRGDGVHRQSGDRPERPDVAHTGRGGRAARADRRRSASSWPTRIHAVRRGNVRQRDDAPHGAAVAPRRRDSPRTLARHGGQTAVGRPRDALSERRQSRPRCEPAVAHASANWRRTAIHQDRQLRRAPHAAAQVEDRGTFGPQGRQAPRSSRAGIATRPTFGCPGCSSAKSCGRRA